MKYNTFFLLVAALLCCDGLFAQNEPVADPAAQVVCGNARFTVLTDRIVRMEWSEDACFEDRATLAVINRRLPVPAFKSTLRNGELTIRTSALTLKYSGNGRFDKENLSVSFVMGGRKVVWTPGADASGNLMGTARTLDGCSGRDRLRRDVTMEPGVISRDGWAVVDESLRHVLQKDSSSWGEWVEARPEGDRQDLYIFAYGHDYRTAISDFTKLAGRIPLPPKYVFGYWWSRYWAYSDSEFLELGKEFRDRKIPMDVMIIDMDWHETWFNASRRERRDEFGQSVGWTGYTWNRDLFGDPEGFLGELHEMGFKTALNLHPASGIVPREACYDSFVADYLSRTSDYDGPHSYIYADGDSRFDGKPAKKGYRAAVPFRIDQKEWADAYFNSVLHPLEKQGVDFWWLDWQQWKESKYTPGLSNTFWLNYTFFNDHLRESGDKALSELQRPLIYHRWGGLGSHRYQLGFSGDTFINWEVLGYLPYFTATASNVCYGYWGHDLGGHMQRGDIPTDPELYTRWLQYGVFSPIFKTHCTKSGVIERRIWAFPEHYGYMLDAFELRYALSPYIYDAARQAYDTGISLCRPMYYYYPEEENAYSFKDQYFFGDNILAATVCEKADSLSGTAPRKVWLPAGCDWYDMAHHKTERGGSVKTLRYSIAQNCWFVKAGSIIPLAKEGIQSLQEKTDEWRIFVAPGKGSSSYLHYEDDGRSQAYASEYAVTRIDRKASASTCTVNIGVREGSYNEMPAGRKLTVIFGGLNRKPAKVSVNSGNHECTYNPETLEASVDIAEMPADVPVTITVKF